MWEEGVVRGIAQTDSGLDKAEDRPTGMWARAPCQPDESPMHYLRIGMQLLFFL